MKHVPIRAPIHDAYCRCRACKPPVPAEFRPEILIVAGGIAAGLVTVALIAIAHRWPAIAAFLTH
jgi:hypothetical protein